MRNEDYELEKLVRRRKALSRWFLLTLALNIFLQFDVVEEFFSHKIAQIQVAELYKFTPALEVCGAEVELRSPYQRQNSIGQALLLAGFSTNSFQFKPFTAAGSFEYLEGLEVKANLGYNQLFVFPYFALSFSGLSPPIS